MNTYRYTVEDYMFRDFYVYVPYLNEHFRGDNKQEALDYAYEALYAKQGDHYFEMEEF